MASVSLFYLIRPCPPRSRPMKPEHHRIVNGLVLEEYRVAGQTGIVKVDGAKVDMIWAEACEWAARQPRKKPVKKAAP